MCICMSFSPIKAQLVLIRHKVAMLFTLLNELLLLRLLLHTILTFVACLLLALIVVTVAVPGVTLDFL